MKDRISLLIKALNFTAAQFAEEIGVQKSGISHIISGRNNPSLEFINKILLRFPEVNMEWLMMGKGPMIRGELNKNKPVEPILTPRSDQDIKTPDLFSFEISSPERIKNEDEINYNRLSTKDGEMKAQQEKVVNNVLAENLNSMTTNENFVQTIKRKKIERILFFYADNTFKEYIPEA
jgi:transcriptional regulator with XRE-family HTH domain